MAGRALSGLGGGLAAVPMAVQALGGALVGALSGAIMGLANPGSGFPSAPCP